MGPSYSPVNNAQLSVTLLFDGAKWIALLERHDQDGYAVCEVFCGLSEPILALVYEMLLDMYPTLEFIRPQGVTEAPLNQDRRPNFKRMQRESRRLLAQVDTMVRVRDATREERALQKAQAAAAARAERVEWEAEEYERRQARKKEKHRGR